MENTTTKTTTTPTEKPKSRVPFGLKQNEFDIYMTIAVVIIGLLQLGFTAYMIFKKK